MFSGPRGRNQVWVACYCIVVEGLNSKTMCMKPLVVMGGVNCERGGENGEILRKEKNSKIYHLQKGQDAQVR